MLNDWILNNYYKIIKSTEQDPVEDEIFATKIHSKSKDKISKIFNTNIQYFYKYIVSFWILQP